MKQALKTGLLLALFCTLLASGVTAQTGRICPPGPVNSDAPVIRLGAALSLTGRFQTEGQQMNNGYQLWAETINTSFGGVDVGGICHQIALIVYDDRSDPNTIPILLENLIIEDEVNFILGPYGNELTRAAALITEQEGMLMIGGVGTDESLFERGLRYFFALITPAEHYSRLAVEQAAASGATTAVIVHVDLGMPNAVALAAQARLRQAGIQVLAAERHAPNVTDLNNLFAGFNQLAPNLFIGLGYNYDVALYINAAVNTGFTPDGFFVMTEPAGFDLQADRFDGILTTASWLLGIEYADEFFGSAADYAELYSNRFDQEVGGYAAEATAIGLALQQAIEAAGSLDISTVQITLQRLDIDTFYGPVNFDHTGRSIVEQTGLVQMQSGRWTPVAPAEVAEADIIWPFPGWFGERR